MIELGGNIKLIGFDDMEPGTLVVVKKMVGNYAKRIDDIKKLDEISIELKDKEKNAVEVKLKIGDNNYEEKGEAKNLFFVLHDVLEKLVGKVA